MDQRLLLHLVFPKESKKAPKLKQYGSLTILVLLILLQGCRKQPDDAVQPVTPDGKTADQYNADVATKWAALQLKLAKSTAGNTPPVVSRALGYTGLTLYEAVVPGMPSYRSLAGQVNSLTVLPVPEANKEYNWALSANAAQATITRGLWANTSASNKQTIDSLEITLLAQLKVQVSDSITNRSVSFGKSIANAIFTHSKTDGGHEGYLSNFPASYVVAKGAGLWQPTENGQKIPMQPYWGNVRTFIKANADMAMPKPLPYSTDSKSETFAQYLDVYNKSKSLTQSEKDIAVWWADNPGETFTPPGHSYNITRIAAITSNANLAIAAEAFAKTGMSVADAFIICWRCKYTYNNIRPYTYVRLTIDPNWKPFWPAPPFPGFPSGHATQSSAAATALASVFGANFAFNDDSHINRTRDVARNVDFKARSFKSFAEAAQESADSRFYGNIHTRQDNVTGLTEGKKIGTNVNMLAWHK